MVAELRPPVLHLLDVDLAGERVGELDLGLVLRRVEVRHLRGRVAVEEVAVDVDAQAASLPVAGELGRRRSRAARAVAALAGRRQPMAVPQVRAARGDAGEHHAFFSSGLKDSQVLGDQRLVAR